MVMQLYINDIHEHERQAGCKFHFLVLGHLNVFITQFNCVVERCSKSSCTPCTLRFLRSVRLALEPLMTINRGALYYITIRINN